MNRGVMLKAAIETWPSTLLCALLLFGAEMTLAYAIPTFSAQFTESIAQIKFLQNFVGAMLGVRAGGEFGPEAFLAFPWVHPVVLALVWAHALLCCTRMPAAEIDRGTADVTMTLPVTRWGMLLSETIVWLAAGAVLLGSFMAGNWCGAQFVEKPSETDWPRSLAVLANLACLYFAVGALGWLASTLNSRRGPALVIVFVILLASFLLNFLAQFWDVADRLSFLSVLEYYRPLFVLRDGTVPWRDMGVLLATGAVFWTAAGVVFGRRDICTV